MKTKSEVDQIAQFQDTSAQKVQISGQEKGKMLGGNIHLVITIEEVSLCTWDKPQYTQTIYLNYSITYGW